MTDVTKLLAEVDASRLTEWEAGLCAKLHRELQRQSPRFSPPQLESLVALVENQKARAAAAKDPSENFESAGYSPAIFNCDFCPWQGLHYGHHLSDEHPDDYLRLRGQNRTSRPYDAI